MFDPVKAAAVQARLAAGLELRPLGRKVRLVAGVDCSYEPSAGRIGAAVVLLTYPELEPVEIARATADLRMPYIPGFLNFREGPVILRAMITLRTRPDVTLFDGNGIAHPRRMGLASYVGAVLKIPTIGCAKNPFFPFREPGPGRGDHTDWFEPGGGLVGTCLRTRAGVKPVFVSPGNRIDIAGARELTAACSRYRIPEPLRRAHRHAGGIF